MDLLDLRNQLDKIDAQIVELYENRMELCKQVAEYKISTGKRCLINSVRRKNWQL